MKTVTSEEHEQLKGLVVEWAKASKPRASQAEIYSFLGEMAGDMQNPRFDYRVPVVPTGEDESIVDAYSRSEVRRASHIENLMGEALSRIARSAADWGDLYEKRFGDTPLRDDFALGEYWFEILRSARRLLDGPTGRRVNAGEIESRIVMALAKNWGEDWESYRTEDEVEADNVLAKLREKEAEVERLTKAATLLGGKMAETLSQIDTRLESLVSTVKREKEEEENAAKQHCRSCRSTALVPLGEVTSGEGKPLARCVACGYISEIEPIHLTKEHAAIIAKVFDENGGYFSKVFDENGGYCPDPRAHYCEETINDLGGRCFGTSSKLVYHSREGKAYWMCAPHAEHNLKNRGGVDVTPDQNPNEEGEPNGRTKDDRRDLEGDREPNGGSVRADGVRGEATGLPNHTSEGPSSEVARGGTESE